MIRFLLNREEVAIGESRGDVTVLDYLRDLRQKCGTKEGCASGGLRGVYGGGGDGGE